MEIALKPSEKLNVKIGDQTYLLSKPKMRDNLALEKALLEAKDSKAMSVDVMVSWVEGLGLPREVILDLEQESFVELIEKIQSTMTSKKN